MHTKLGTLKTTKGKISLESDNLFAVCFSMLKKSWCYNCLWRVIDISVTEQSLRSHFQVSRNSQFFSQFLLRHLEVSRSQVSRNLLFFSRSLTYLGRKSRNQGVSSTVQKRVLVSWVSMFCIIPLPTVNINCVYYFYRDNQCIGFILSSILMCL